MVDTRIILSILWVALMLIYFLGDVLRIFAGDFEPGRIGKGVQATQGMWLLIAIIMLIPIVMVVLTMTLVYPAIRWVNISVAIFMVVFNLFGLPYPGAYDNFLIFVSFVFNALTVWYAWNWVI
jgi:archaellum biogenesis protein FlaJ (TadC family)